MKKIILNCEVVTPLFISGAEKGRAELRTASIKGVLRFWWRTLHGDIRNPKKLLEEESKIFGGAGEVSNEKRSSFSMKIINKNLRITKRELPEHKISVSAKGRIFKINILSYLSYGSHIYDKQIKKLVLDRCYISPGSTFTLKLNFIDTKCKEEVLNSFFLLHSFGGIGAHSRNGFGSIRIINLKDNFQKVKQLYNCTSIPEFPAFSKGNSIYFEHPNFFNSWDESLAKIGKIYREARLSLEPKHKYDLRQFIGAPIYIKIGRQTIKKSCLERHAKPYFIKVYKTDSGKYKCGILFLKSRYAPDMDKNGNLDKQFWEATEKLNKKLKDHRLKVIPL